ncbi:MAG: hypothetical protein LBB94_09585 [Clostridiales bacterium]|jgi:hypothetical protein|nr:hypothetical protein [Clostridiales bacterium]
MKEKELGVGSFQELSDEELVGVSGGTFGIISSLFGVATSLVGGAVGVILSPITSIFSSIRGLFGGGNSVGSLFNGLGR